ncbi:MAG: hypothetical protein M0Z53_05620 [Thermaerobacter sp.]|nr:hypothetical protein [Thermaerobacter sp.]
MRRTVSWVPGYVWCLTRILWPTPSGRQRVNGLRALPAITPPVIPVTHDTDINRESVVTLRKNRAEPVTDRPIPLVLDNARYERHASVMAEAERRDYLALVADVFTRRNFIARLADEL